MLAAMIAPLATLAFLATLWLVAVAGAAMLEESGARIAAALKGRSTLRESFGFAPARVRARVRVRQPMRARPRLRAAA